MHRVFEVRVTLRVRVNINLRRLGQSRRKYQTKFIRQSDLKAAKFNISQCLTGLTIAPIFALHAILIKSLTASQNQYQSDS